MRVIDRARGATLLVDEAYQLTPKDSTRDFGIEALETIMGVIEGSEFTVDDRPAVIFAGYPSDMDRFIAANSGLRRRLTNVFTFENYTHVEIFEICKTMAGKSGFTIITEEAVAVQKMQECFPVEFCATYNAGLARELLIASKGRINVRLFDNVFHATAITKEDLMSITEYDFLQACDHVKRNLC